MINIALLHRLIKERVNKMDSNHYQDMLPDVIDDAIYRASLSVLGFYDYKSNERQWVKDLIAPFIVSWPEEPEITPIATFNIDNAYIDFDLTKLKKPYFRFLRGWLACNEFVAPVSLIRQDDQYKLNNSYLRSDPSWGRYVGMITAVDGNPTLRVFTDNTNFKLRIEYIKAPKRVFLGGYDTIEYIDCVRRTQSGTSTENCNQYYNSQTAPVDSEFMSNALDLLVDMAVYFIAGATENQLVLQLVNASIGERKQIT
ncbi:MAG: hypothetical protein D6711_10720 [Chloroflexi bacterium]|nr:MAG: hypothetical protein D6711_10720 [Chloroflexota bacterium]